MAKASLTQVVSYCDRLLATDQFEDWPGAVNGLQVQNEGQVTRIAATVDASLATVRLALEAKADLLLVHHGLFWGPTHPWTGKRYQLLRLLLEGNLAVYSSHLPLDAHPTFGNNALLCRALDFKHLVPFFVTKGRPIGFRTETKVARDRLIQQVAAAVGRTPTILPGGPSTCRRIGVVTGGAGDELKQAASEGVDTFITGEGRHWTFALAEELEVNVIYAGHYATETFGVKALARHLARRFRLDWLFVDHPTGL